MSFRFAPIVENPIQKSACEKPENLNEKACDYLDRVHPLPRLVRYRDSASRPGNPFNKRTLKSGKGKKNALRRKVKDLNQYADQRFQRIIPSKREINLLSNYIFSLFFQ